jgi:hypothetical protein
MQASKTLAFAAALLCVIAAVAGCTEEKNVTEVVANPSHDERFPIVSGTTRLISDDITYDITLEEDGEYLLRGSVFVRDGATLTIPPGVTVYGESATIGTLIIDQGAKIYAVGTADNPIVFTSDSTAGSRSAGDWGGIIINGYATINTVDGGGGTAEGEGDTGTYGGSDDHDCSGALRYVVVQFAGQLYSPDNELNGIALQAVGDGTVVEYVQVHRNDDDGIEWFGGTCNARYVVITACEDDHLDWTHGARFKLQYGIVDLTGAADPDRGIEADNYEFGEDNTPRSHPIISNVTFIGADDGTASGKEGMVLRRGTEAQIFNSIIHDFDIGLEIDSDSTFDNGSNVSYTAPDLSKLALQGIIFSGCVTSNAKNHTYTGSNGVTWNVDYFDTGTQSSPLYNMTATGSVIYWVSNRDYWSIGEALTATTIDVAALDDWFDTAGYIGGCREGYKWYEGWTSFPAN